MTYFLLLVAFCLAAYYAWAQHHEAVLAREQRDWAIGKANEALDREANVRELLEQSYVGLQAMAEKHVEAEWIRQDGHYIQPGVWVGDVFHEVEEAEMGDIEVGQSVGGGVYPRYSGSSKVDATFHDGGPAGESAEFGGTVPLSTEDTDA